MVNRMNRCQRSYTPNNNCANRMPSCNAPKQIQSRNTNTSCSKEAKQLIAKLQAVDFSMVDTILYLDVYPHCQKAMAYYRELLCQKEALLAKLAEAGVPMNNMSVIGDQWNWTDSPWPWDLEANV